MTLIESQSIAGSSIGITITTTTEKICEVAPCTEASSKCSMKKPDSVQYTDVVLDN